ncbi:MAG: hypothetical protein RL552_774, partial [Actinomycetota bacterium]
VAAGGLLAVHDVFERAEDGGQAPYEEIYLAAIESKRYVDESRCGSLRVLRRVA